MTDDSGIEHISDEARSWQDQLLQAKSAGRQIMATGVGSTRCLLPRQPGPNVQELATARHCGILLYEPGELILRARSGTPLASIVKLLASENQMLTFEPPSFSPGATLGGCYAMGLAGPRRAYSGGLRESVLGIQLLDCKGQLMNFGGRVMKNVAGFDVARALVGSRGAFGIISEITLRVMAIPETESTLHHECSAEEAIHYVNTLAGTPCPLSASMWWNGRLYVRLSGTARRVETAIRHLGWAMLDAEAGGLFWQSLRDQTMPFFQSTAAHDDAMSLWRVSVPATCRWTIPEDTQDCMIEWAGGIRWFRTSAKADAVRDMAHNAGGSAWLWHKGAELKPCPFTPKCEGSRSPLSALQQKLKQQLDPDKLFFWAFDPPA